jgi:hypothetical protein
MAANSSRVGSCRGAANCPTTWLPASIIGHHRESWDGCNNCYCKASFPQTRHLVYHNRAERVIILRQGVLCEEVARALVTALSLPDDTIHTRGIDTIPQRERAKSGLLTHVLTLMRLLAEWLGLESSPSLGLGSVPFILEMLGGRLKSRWVHQHCGIIVPQDVEESENSLLDVPHAHALSPALEDAVKRTRS